MDATLASLLAAALESPGAACIAALADLLVEVSPADRIAALSLLVNPLPPGVPAGFTQAGSVWSDGWSLLATSDGKPTFRLHQFFRTRTEAYDDLLGTVAGRRIPGDRQQRIDYYRKRGWRAVRARIVPCPDLD